MGGEIANPDIKRLIRPHYKYDTKTSRSQDNLLLLILRNTIKQLCWQVDPFWLQDRPCQGQNYLHCRSAFPEWLMDSLIKGLDKPVQVWDLFNKIVNVMPHIRHTWLCLH